MENVTNTALSLFESAMQSVQEDENDDRLITYLKIKTKLSMVSSSIHLIEAFMQNSDFVKELDPKFIKDISVNLDSSLFLIYYIIRNCFIESSHDPEFQEILSEFMNVTKENKSNVV